MKKHFFLLATALLIASLVLQATGRAEIADYLLQLSSWIVAAVQLGKL